MGFVNSQKALQAERLLTGSFPDPDGIYARLR